MYTCMHMGKGMNNQCDGERHAWSLDAHIKWEAKSNLECVMVTLLVGNSQAGESKNTKKIRRLLEVKILKTNMPGWNTKSWKQTCQAGKPNPGKKHARVGHPDSGTHLSVQSPFSGGFMA